MGKSVMYSSQQLLQKVKEISTTFTWYDNLVQPNNISKLSDLPLMTTDILERYYYGKAVPGATGVYETSKTSANKRKLISYSNADEKIYLDIKTKRFAEILAGTDIQKVFIDVGVGHVCSTSGVIFERLGLEDLNIDINLPIEDHIKLLLDFKPGLLYMPPSLIDIILHIVPDPRIFRIQKIVPIGEVVTKSWMKNTAKAFGLNMADIHLGYGITEIGQVAIFSHTIGKYEMVDGVYAECLSAGEIDHSLGPLAHDEQILVLTSFNRNFFPGLRFVTYDVVRGFETIMVDGMVKQVFAAIPRRVGTEFKHGERISIHDIEDVVLQHLDRAVIRASVRDNQLTVGILSRNLTGEILEKIAKDIQEAVPEIGIMINSGLLAQIRVERLDERYCFDTGAKKKKKIAS